MRCARWLCHFCRDSSSSAVVALYSTSSVVVAYVFVMPSFPLPPYGSIPPESNKATFPVTALHRFSTLPPYTIEQPVALPSIGPTQGQVHDASFIPNVPSEVVHQYTLTSRGRDYALITVTSHAQNAQDPPLLYFGEELKGSVVLSSNGLGNMRSIDVVVSQFF